VVSKLKELANTIHTRSLWQVLAVYLGVGWGVIEATKLFAEDFGLPSWLSKVAWGLLAVGLVTIVVLALLPAPAQVPEATEGQSDDQPRGRFSTWRTGGIALLGASAAWGVVVTLWLVFGGPSPEEDWARTDGILELRGLVEEERWEEAFTLAHRLEVMIEDDRLDSLWTQLSTPLAIESDPAGAQVFRRPYAAVDSAWEDLGATPLRVERFPNSPSVLRFSLDGHPDLEMAGAPGWEFQDPLHIRFHSSIPEGFNWVRGDFLEILDGPEFAFRYVSPTLSLAPPLRLDDFLLQRHEVTNAEFKRFVDEGGYEREDLWAHPFILDGRELTWEEAMARFTDQTERPGPSTWEFSDYQEGTEDLPVGGISWFEAAAYARFVGMELPTVYHWYRASTSWRSDWILPLSAMSREGPVPVGSSGGMSQFGQLDMAGNVREWAYNSSGDEKFILGGGWDDASYTFTVANTTPPFDRTETNGVRLAQYPEDTPVLALARQPIDRPHRDFTTETPVTEELYEAYRGYYAYDPMALDPVVEAADTTEDWIRERVVINAAYRGQRLPLYLYRPREGHPPFQTVLYFPGSGALWIDSFEEYPTDHASMMVKSGRAFLFPVYQSTFERDDGFVYRRQEPTDEYLEHVVQWMQDLSRALDYLETRPDMDADKVAYFGFSWGGMLAPIALALEPRLKVGILQAGGLSPLPTLKPVDPFHFVTRVTVPVLMLNGEYDGIHPLETAARPMFNLLGTPDQDKRLSESPVGHMTLNKPAMGEALGWLDTYLGEPGGS
jgi:dienelactone hydrolase